MIWLACGCGGVGEVALLALFCGWVAAGWRWLRGAGKDEKQEHAHE